MALSVVRLGSPRGPREGLRIGTARRPPRGVPKSRFALDDWFDVWLPELAPSAGLLAFATAGPLTQRRWTTFARRYRAEMRQPPAARLITLLAAFSHQADIAIGCYCDDESRCHRSLLEGLLREAGASGSPG